MTLQFPTRATLLQLHQAGMSQNDLARRFECSRSKIRYWLGDDAITDDSLRYGTRYAVRILHDPSGTFSPRAEFRMAELAFGAMPSRDDDTILYADGENTVTRPADDGIVWAEGTVFAIGRPGMEVQATCTGGVIVCEDGRVMVPNKSGGVKWTSPE